jgi:hypothetical protein
VKINIQSIYDNYFEQLNADDIIKNYINDIDEHMLFYLPFKSFVLEFVDSHINVSITIETREEKEFEKTYYVLYAENKKRKFHMNLKCDKFKIVKMTGNMLISTEEIITNDISVSSLVVVIVEMLKIFLKFIHCKNVILKQENTINSLPSRIKNHWIKKGKTGELYYVLTISPLKKENNKQKHSVYEGEGEVQSLHICRGHFADYSQGKGLFGKHKGTYWIPDHVKGSKEVGEIKKDYKIII